MKKKSKVAAYLARRMQQHAAACAGLEADPLILAAFAKPQPLKYMASPMLPGWSYRHQAD